MAEALKSETRAVMTLTELQASPEYLACTPKMKCWLTTLIENGFDYPHATSVAFQCKNARQAQVFSYAVRKWTRIRTCLNLYLGKSVRDVLLEEVIENIRHAERGSVAMQRLLAQKERLLFGGESETASETSPVRFRVGDIAILDGETKIRVTAVDDQGRATEGDPIP